MDIGNLVLRTIPLSEPIVGSAVGIVALLVAGSSTWFLSSTLFRSNDYNKPITELISALNVFVTALAFAIAAIYKSLVDSFTSLIDTVQKNLSLLLGTHISSGISAG